MAPAALGFILSLIDVLCCYMGDWLTAGLLLALDSTVVPSF
jgi:hypothetical protein